MEREKLKADTKLKKAEVGRRMWIEGAFDQKAARRAMDPTVTPEERRAARDSLKEMREGVAGGNVQLTGNRTPIAIDTGAPPTDAFDEMEATVREGKGQRELIAEAMGKTLTPQ